MKQSFSSILYVIGGAFVAGLLLSPYIFNGLLWLGRNFDALEFLRNVEFERVVYRTVLLFAVFSVVVVFIQGHYTSFKDVGWTHASDRWRLLGWGLLVSVLSILIIYFVGWMLEAYEVHPKSISRLVTKTLTYGVGALLVAMIEETLFRGVLFNALRKEGRWVRAALVSSLMFSLIHFAKPIPPFGTVYGDWDSAIRLIPYMFNVQGELYHVFPYALTLFMLGMVLAVAYQKSGSIYLSVGLHMGWVWAVRVPDVFLARVQRVFPLWFSPGDALAKSYAALLISALFLIGLWWMYRVQESRA